jgi:hypothetical protein
MLIMAKGRRFARRPAGHKTVGALVDLPLDVPLKGAFVELSVLERRDQGGDRASKGRYWHVSKLLRPNMLRSDVLQGRRTIGSEGLGGKAWKALPIGLDLTLCGLTGPRASQAIKRDDPRP